MVIHSCGYTSLFYVCQPCAAHRCGVSDGEGLHVMRKDNDRYSDGLEGHNGPRAGRGSGEAPGQR